MDLNKVAKNKTTKLKKLIQETAKMLFEAGIPMRDLTPRRIEKMSMCILALGDITKLNNWENTKSINDAHILKSRDIIRYINEHFEEKISEGSYDDIRRKDLVRFVDLELVVKSANKLNADTNDGTRGNALSVKFSELIKKYKTIEWANAVADFGLDDEYIKAFTGKREVKKLRVNLPSGMKVELDDGPHNKIQKAIVEQFLPIYGYNSSVLYIGDTSEKQMVKFTEKMIELGLNVEDRGMLPDIIAFSENKKWLYLIEAVHSSNPLNPERCMQLKKQVLKNCSYGVVFVTAFLTRKDFAKWMPQIAWETEVWLADTPEHLIHFNGDKFMGPHNE